MLAAVKYVPARRPARAGRGRASSSWARTAPRTCSRSRSAHGDLFTWDFIGALQSRKVKDVAPHVRLIHSVASESALRKLEQHPADGGADPGERGRRGGRRPGIEPGELGDFIARCPVPVTGLMTMPPFVERPEDNRRHFARLAELAAEHGLDAPLDGHVAGLRGGRRGGRDDRAPGHRALRRVAHALEEVGDQRSTAARPARRAATRPSPRPPARSSGSLRQYSWATPSGWSQSDSSCEPTTSTGISSCDELLEALPGDRARHLAQRLRPPRRGRRGAPSAGASPRVPPRASARGRSPGCATSRNAVDPAVERVGQLLPGLAVGVAGARVARVGGGDLHERRHPLRVLERERHRRGGAHGAAHERRPSPARARPAPPRGRPPGPSTRSSARGCDSPWPRAS